MGQNLADTKDESQLYMRPFVKAPLHTPSF